MSINVSSWTRRALVRGLGTIAISHLTRRGHSELHSAYWQLGYNDLNLVTNEFFSVLCSCRCSGLSSLASMVGDLLSLVPCMGCMGLGRRATSFGGGRKEGE